jgi:hypothetical protein
MILAFDLACDKVSPKVKIYYIVAANFTLPDEKNERLFSLLLDEDN